jgi:antitoxin component YwqK of YwqJK toxin-antitoxin module
MKKIFILTYLLCYQCLCFSQDTKLITKTYSNKQVWEQYNVLMTDNETKDGDYISYFSMNNVQFQAAKKEPELLKNFIKLKGKYKNGKKDGFWIEYAKPEQIKTKGNYIADKKVGIWETPQEANFVMERFDFDKNEKLEPFFGELRVAFPIQDREKPFDGTVIVAYQISSDCKTTNITIKQGLAKEFNEAALRSFTYYVTCFEKYSQKCSAESKTMSFHFVN